MSKKIDNPLQVEWHIQGEPSVAWDNIWQKLLTQPPKAPSKPDMPGVEYQPNSNYSGGLN
jgi:hypothetical protein